MEQRVHLSHALTRARVGFKEQSRRPVPGQNHSSIAGGSFLLPLDTEDSHHVSIISYNGGLRESRCVVQRRS